MKNLTCPTCGVHIDEHYSFPCLDAWIAELGGCKPVKYLAGYVCECESNDAFYYPHGLCHKYQDIPNYSTRLIAAWDLLEKIDGFKEIAYCEEFNWRFGYVVSETQMDYVYAETSTLAICRAYVKSRDVK